MISCCDKLMINWFLRMVRSDYAPFYLKKMIRIKTITLYEKESNSWLCDGYDVVA